MIGFIDGVINNVGWALIWMPAAHFALSAIVGLLVYWLTSTILSFGLSKVSLKGNYHILGDSFIHRFSLVVALCFSVAVHVLEDYIYNIF